MIQKNNINQRIEETLDSLDGIQRASAGPFFYTRLKAKLDQGEKSAWETISSFISRPAMVFATICVVLLLNVVILFRKQSTEIISSSAADQNDQTLNNAYDVASSTNTNATILNIWNQDNEQRIQK